MITLLHGDTPFPPVEQALRTPSGLLAAGGDLTPARLLDAYRHGIFPWFNAGDTILWWSPDPRMVLFPEELKISRSLRKTLRKKTYEIRTDTAFGQVIRACAAPRTGQAGTWIHDEMIAAYTELHRMGAAHSVETWMNGELVGGLYGISIGRMFYGESMFSRSPDASKVALAYLAAQSCPELCRRVRCWNFDPSTMLRTGMIDCQMSTPHLASLGAREIPRAEFIQRLQELIHYPDVTSPWCFDEHELIE